MSVCSVEAAVAFLQGLQTVGVVGIGDGARLCCSITCCVRQRAGSTGVPDDLKGARANLSRWAGAS